MKSAFLLVLLLASSASADFWRISVRRFTCFESREWTTDNLAAILNLVTIDQNVTTNGFFGNGTAKGSTSLTDDLWKDITLSGNEPDLTVGVALFNRGDNDPQEAGLRITSLVLTMIQRLPYIGVPATAIKLLLQLFQGSYECEGPVAVAATIVSRVGLQNMQYGTAQCKTERFQYLTGQGCVDVNPISTKNSDYEVVSCLERFSGSSSAGGGTVVASRGELKRFPLGLCLTVMAAVVVWIGFC